MGKYRYILQTTGKADLKFTGLNKIQGPAIELMQNPEMNCKIINNLLSTKFFDRIELDTELQENRKSEQQRMINVFRAISNKSEEEILYCLTIMCNIPGGQMFSESFRKMLQDNLKGFAVVDTSHKNCCCAAYHHSTSANGVYNKNSGSYGYLNPPQSKNYGYKDFQSDNSKTCRHPLLQYTGRNRDENDSDTGCATNELATTSFKRSNVCICLQGLPEREADEESLSAVCSCRYGTRQLNCSFTICIISFTLLICLISTIATIIYINIFWKTEMLAVETEFVSNQSSDNKDANKTISTTAFYDKVTSSAMNNIKAPRTTTFTDIYNYSLHSDRNAQGKFELTWKRKNEPFTN